MTRLLPALALFACSLIAGASAAADEMSPLERVKQSGVLKVALYNNFPPFSNHGTGVDVDVADALAAKLGVRMSALWFDADENMEDDLRNMVWKGHYLGYGPADVMIHAPVDRDFSAKVDKVRFFAPYHRERYAVGRMLEKLPICDSFDKLESLPYAVEGDTLAASVMLSLEGGRYGKSLRVYKTGGDAVAALRSGTVPLAIAQQGELEAGLGSDARFAIDQAPNPILQKRQWAVGLAVKAHSDDLAQALQHAMNELLADGSIKRIMQRHGVQHRAP
ncbi:MAG: ABC transporter substrate-binding protein [Rhodocyclales bacterium]|nr:ABC transporter substrate-binding protein [Rhodocyclales bacterium]